MDLNFMTAGRDLGQRFDMELVERLATTLLNERKLDSTTIEALFSGKD